MAALGSRLLTSLQAVAEASRLEIREGWAELTATREDRPPHIKEVRVILHLQSAVPRERLVDLAQRNSTVLSTLAMAVPVTVELGEV